MSTLYERARRMFRALLPAGNSTTPSAAEASRGGDATRPGNAVRIVRASVGNMSRTHSKRGPGRMPYQRREHRPAGTKLCRRFGIVPGMPA